MAAYVAPTPQALARAARWWWLYLVLGILWTIYGFLVLSLRPGAVYSLAILAGLSFIFAGVSQLLASARVTAWRWLWIVAGVISIVAGILAFAWPGATLRVLSILVAWFLLFSGISNIIGSFVEHGREMWWVGVLLGLLEVVLGLWAIGSPTRQVLLFINLVGIYMLFIGIGEIFMAFRLRREDHELRS